MDLFTHTIMKAVDERLFREDGTATVQLTVSLVVAYSNATLMQGQAKRGRDDDMTTGNSKSRLNRKTVTFHNVAINPFNPMAFFGLLAYNNRIYESSSCMCHPTLENLGPN
jgi:hypothetical protein